MYFYNVFEIVNVISNLNKNNKNIYKQKIYSFLNVYL